MEESERETSNTSLKMIKLWKKRFRSEAGIFQRKGENEIRKCGIKYNNLGLGLEPGTAAHWAESDPQDHRKLSSRGSSFNGMKG